ncbi:MAG: hypothetical protein MSC30_08425 [Gaiellaceae bacterium MAG52_C11]|nr:hypothetical protein [Candidatus Gaiellasilicea maunaloa]
MRRRTRRTLMAGAGAALAVVGGGAAFAAQSSGDPSAESKSVVNDAAKQLGVDPEKLSRALEQALANRVDAAVKAGRLTEAQGKELKARIEADAFPVFGGRGFGSGRHHDRGLGHLDAAASYLGVTEEALRTSIREGKTLAQVANEKGESIDGLVAAIVADKTKKLDAALARGRLTKLRRDELVSGLEERITVLVNSEHLRGGRSFRRNHGLGPREHPAPQAG